MIAVSRMGSAKYHTYSRGVSSAKTEISSMIKDSTTSTIKPTAITTPAGVFKNTGNLFILRSPIPTVHRRRDQASKSCLERNRRVCLSPVEWSKDDGERPQNGVYRTFAGGGGGGSHQNTSPRRVWVWR